MLARLLAVTALVGAGVGCSESLPNGGYQDDATSTSSAASTSAAGAGGAAASGGSQTTTAASSGSQTSTGGPASGTSNGGGNAASTSTANSTTSAGQGGAGSTTSAGQGGSGATTSAGNTGGSQGSGNGGAGSGTSNGGGGAGGGASNGGGGSGGGGIVDLTGTWVGQWDDSGTTGPIKLTLTQTGNQITGVLVEANCWGGPQAHIAGTVASLGGSNGTVIKMATGATLDFSGTFTANMTATGTYTEITPSCSQTGSGQWKIHMQ